MFHLINGLYWAFLRRVYGGLFSNDKPLGNRGIQTVIMVLSLLVAFVDRTNLWIAFGLALWVQFQFWSRAVGEVLDSGLSHTQDKDSYGRWFRIPLDWVYDKLGKEKYVGMYDWWYMWLRYTLPMLVPAILLSDIKFVVIGLASSPIYFFFTWLFWRFPSLYKLPECIGQPKNMSEIVYGFVFGWLIW